MQDPRRSHHEGRRDDRRRRSRSPRREESGLHHSHERRRRSPVTGRDRTQRSPKERRSPDARSRHDSKRHHTHRKHDHHEADAEPPAVTELPFNARRLHKGEMAAFKPLFAYFLSVQKSIELGDLDEREAKGRWKSFVGKWNRAELAEGWYDPDLFSRVAEMEPEVSKTTTRAACDVSPDSPEADLVEDRKLRQRARADSEDDEDYGPTLPTLDGSGRRAGPGIPSLDDLSLRNEMIEDERRQDREESLKALRNARKADRTEQKERLEELAPRADPGSRERKLEKRQAVNDKMRAFREKSPGMEAADEKEVMGGGDSLDEYKKMKDKEQRKKSERQTRREEFERARREEIEEKRKAWQEREQGTISMLQELAKQRFG